MLSPTILSINWFFSFILLRHLDGIQRNSKASIFETQWFNEFFIFLIEKREGLAFERLKFASSTNRIRRRTLRPESLDWYAARDSERVVRTYQEMDVWPVSLNSTTDHPQQDVRHRVQKWNVGLERRKGLGTSRADVWGNARHFCDG